MSDSIKIYKKYRIGILTKPVKADVGYVEPDQLIVSSFIASADTLKEAREAAHSRINNPSRKPVYGVAIFTAIEALVPRETPIKTVSIK